MDRRYTYLVPAARHVAVHLVDLVPVSTAHDKTGIARGGLDASCFCINGVGETFLEAGFIDAAG